MIHPTAIISPTATIGANTTIGPYCVIEDNVVIGENNTFHSHVVVHGSTTIGNENEFFPFAAIGIKTQDLKYKSEPTSLEIGNGNTFRENTTIHRSTDNKIPTRIGNDNLFLCYSHVAHDCQVANNCILSNSAGIAGHVIVEDYVIVSAMSGVHQFVRLGAHSIIGGMTKAVQDIPPYMIIDGTPGTVRGVNAIGLQRRGFDADDIRALKNSYKKLFLKKDSNFGEALAALSESETAQNPHAKYLIDFAQSTERGITR